MGRFEDAKELVDHARDDLAKIGKMYSEALEAKEVKGRLLVEIKNLLENPRANHVWQRTNAPRPPLNTKSLERY
jgi:hypothetical protein